MCAALPFPWSGCWEVKRERADGVAFSKKCGITGASWWGDGERNCARCVDRVGGERMGWETLEKREGRGHLNYLCSLWPLSPSVSPRTDPLSERRGIFPLADAHPPPLFQIAFYSFCRKLIATIYSLHLMHFYFIYHCHKCWILFLKKKCFFLSVYVWSQNLARRHQIKHVQQNKSKFNWTELFSQTYSARYMQLS